MIDSTDRKKAMMKRFAEEYVIDNPPNGTAAALRAGASPKSARTYACHTLKIPEVASYVAKLQQERAEKRGITAEWVIDRLQREAELPRSNGGSSQSRIAALNLIGKHLGMFGDKVQVEQVEKVEIVLTVVEPRPGDESVPEAIGGVP